jgi:transcriptional regulator with XRE-family HTH domain
MMLGEQRKIIRKKKGLAQKQLAEKLGISTNAMCSIEKGYAWPSGITMEKMCRLLNVELKLIEK